MKKLCFDVETHRGKPGMVAPRLVCLAWAEERACGLLSREDALEWAARALRDRTKLLVGHNLAFDVLVLCAEDESFLPLAVDAYEDDRIRDTMLRQMLIDIGRGERDWRSVRGKRQKAEYGLDVLSDLWLRKKLDKSADTWRLRYHLLDGVPLEDWPEAAKSYPLEDAVTTLEIEDAQESYVSRSEVFLLDGKHALFDEAMQARAALALHAMEAWGLRTDAKLVRRLREILEAEREAALEQLKGTGFFDANGKKKMAPLRKRLEEAFRAAGKKVPETKGGEVSLAQEDLLESGDPDLLIVASISSGGSILSKDIPVLEAGAVAPICTSYVPIQANGRTSSRQPNVQNPPRKGGVRECFVPRPGRLFAFADYSTIELRAFAQVCLRMIGWSAMADAIRAGRDLHLAVAAQILRISEEEALRRFDAGDEEVSDARQISKPANFGFPGGMADPETFVGFCAGQGVKLAATHEEAVEVARDLRKAWLRAFPEAEEYFRIIGALVGSHGEGRIRQLVSNGVRGGVSYTEAANGYWSRLAADGAKSALWRVFVESYDSRKKSALFGCRPVLFVHDEIGSEVYEDLELATRAAERKSKVMVDEMARFIPDLPLEATPVLMRRWWKGAKPLRRPDGLLVPVRPRKTGKKVVWEEDPDGEVLG